MSYIAKIVLALSVLLFSLGDSTKSALKGRVTDEMGAVIPRARIVVHWDPSGNQKGFDSKRDDLILTTNERGEFEEEMPPGFYDLFVSAAAFSPACRKIRLKQEPHGAVNFKLKADPLVSKELGHEIYAN